MINNEKKFTLSVCSYTICVEGENEFETWTARRKRDCDRSECWHHLFVQ